MIPYNATDVLNTMRKEYDLDRAPEAPDRSPPVRTRQLERLVRVVGAVLTGNR